MPYGLLFCSLLGIFSALSQPARAEYRAYELAIRNTATGAEKKVISTLDHIQYPGYYPLARNEVAIYVTSWMCWGRTDKFKPICRNWKADQPAQKPKNTSPTPSASSQPTAS